MPLAVQLVSPERILFEGEAEMVVCRPVDGEIAFLAGHVPFLGALRATTPCGSSWPVARRPRWRCTAGSSR